MTEIEQHYATLSDQHLKPLAAGLVDHLEKEKMPESAQIVRELMRRLYGEMP